MFRTAATAALTVLTLALPAAAQPVTPIVGSAMVDVSAAAIDAFGVAMDTDKNAMISQLEMAIAGHQIFASMDADADGGLSRREMIDWPAGFGDLARFRGRDAEFANAMTMMFDLMDTDRDMRIDAREHAAGLAVAWRLADSDGDARMSLTESARTSWSSPSCAADWEVPRDADARGTTEEAHWSRPDADVI